MKWEWDENRPEAGILPGAYWGGTGGYAGNSVKFGPSEESITPEANTSKPIIWARLIYTGAISDDRGIKWAK